MALALDGSPGGGALCGRVGFNSLGAFASVNHLHVHVMFARGLAGSSYAGCDEARGSAKAESAGFPVEAAPVAETFAYAETASGGVRVDLLDWPVPCFSFKGPPAAATAEAGLLLERLVAEAVPHNLLIVPPPYNTGSHLRLIVFPRQAQHLSSFDPQAQGFNAAVCECSGLLVAFEPSGFGGGEDGALLTDARVSTALQEGVGLGAEEVERLAATLRRSA